MDHRNNARRLRPANLIDTLSSRLRFALVTFALLVFPISAHALGFATEVSYELSETSPVDILTADFNNDGNNDLAVSMSGEAGGVGSVSILLGDGNGTFPDHQ